MEEMTETLTPPPPTAATTSMSGSQTGDIISIPLQSAEQGGGGGDKGTGPTEKRKRDDDSPRGKGDADSTPSSGCGKPPLWKTSLCSYFRNPKGCSHGESCRYAHSEDELRPRPDNTWDPTSQRAKKLQKTSATTGTNGSQAQPKQKGEEEEDEVGDPIEAGDDDGDDTSTTLDKCLIGLPMNWGSDNLKNFLDKQGIFFKSAKKKKRMAVGFVVFENIEQVKRAVEVLSEKSTGGKQIKVANATRRYHEKQHSSETTEIHPSNDEDGNVAAADDDTSITEGLVPKTRSARDVVTPLAHLPYADQLEQKRSSLSQTLKRLTRNARKACPNAVQLPEWILKSREIGGLPCNFEGILESPMIDGYRNKCEFSVGYSLQGERTVGFMLGNFREGVTAVEEPFNCPNVSRIACQYALIFQEILRSSVLPVWNRINSTGFWRQLTVREGRNSDQAAETSIGEVMLIIQVCSLDVDEEQMNSEFKRMSQAFAQGAASCSPPLPLTTIVVQDHKGISNAAPADCPLLPIPIPNVEGSSAKISSVIETRIHDYISNLRFSISPTAFFQVNTLAAERLYSLAGDWAELNSDTLLFDVCCGTGTIGLTLAHRVGMVVGIEMNESAVTDAHRNAQLNGIKNCKFVCGKAEDVIGAVLKEYLGAPQQQDDSPDGSVGNGVDEDAVNHEAKNEKILSGSDVPVDALAAIANEKDIFVHKRSSERTGVSNKGNNANDFLEDENCNHETFGAHSSTELLENCTKGCRSISGENKECGDVNEGNLEEADTNEENCEHRTTGQDEYLSVDKGTVAAPAYKNIVALVDPPRVGLHPTVIRALRTHPRIRRLVYISCNPESLVANAIELCTPTSEKLEKGKGNRGWRKMSSAGLARHRTKSMPFSEPFRPVKAMAVDLFPHTPHCEMVMLLER